MKAHIGVDDDSGLVHHVECTAANVADITQAHKLLHGKEDTVCGDSGYTGLEKREEMKRKRTLRYLIETLEAEADQEQTRTEVGQALGAHQGQPAGEGGTPVPGDQASVGYVKVRYRGLVKNTAQMLTLFALSNLWLKRKELMPAAGNVCL